MIEASLVLSSGMNECLQIRPNYQCPVCQTEMTIAGKTSRDSNDERAEGKSVTQRYTCHKFSHDIVPVRINRMDS